ncbi:hypothetical protein QQS21_005768 [Conoideocrella luteorostrata]|uniref:NAD(P)-binding domain-containing protein n=1 Tax=Conoideocrella luteorostrata TaxID=1105319 RepID=A0AAJ0CPX7_9HYPO|nr:hypothetical protein QQS21_005768 [Conoideocrella luteorostrata]
MHFFIIGGSGRNGQLTTQAALDRGHSVTALVRNPSSLTPHERLTVVRGTPTSLADIQKGLTTPQHPSTVFYTLNPRRTSENPFAPLSPESPTDLLESTMRTLIAAINSTSFPPPKLVINSTMGVGASFASMTAPIRFVFRHSTMRVTLDDHTNLDTVVRESGLPFVLARPARLVEGEAGELRVLSDDGKGSGWNPTVKRASLARWMVGAAEVKTWDGRAPVLTT